MGILSKFKKSPKVQNAEVLEGVITFFGAHHALKGEKVLALSGVKVMLIPGPREISPNCGTALRFDYLKRSEVAEILAANDVLFEKIHHYPV